LASQLKQKEEDRLNVQSELDDLLMVFSDVEEKAKQHKVYFPAAFVALTTRVCTILTRNLHSNDFAPLASRYQMVKMMSMLMEMTTTTRI
jgi:hypothetical protein